MKSIRMILVLVSVMLSSCGSSEEEITAATEAYSSQIRIVKTMVAGTAEFETKLAIALQQTLTSQPTSAATESADFSPTPMATDTEVPIPTPAATDSPTLTPHEQQRTSLVLLCFALHSHYYLNYEYFEVQDAWEPNVDDYDVAPEYRDALNFSLGALALRDSVDALPFSNSPANNFIRDLNQAYEQLGRAYDYLALHYKDGSQSAYNEHKSSWEETWQLYDQAWDEWEDIADEYDFDSVYCKRTGGQPILGLAQEAGENLSTEDVMENIEDQVSALRGWQLKDEPERRLMTREELRDYNEEHFWEDTTHEEMDDDARTLVALDLIETGFDLYKMYFDYRTEGILGFYDKDEDVMVDISELDDLDEVGRTTHAHEYQHALQFHNNDMEAIGYSDEGWEEDSERAGAIQAVIEGEANLVEHLWKNAYFTIEEHESEIELGEAMDPPPEAPRWYEDSSRFPYRDGYNFVANVYSVGGWSAVDKLYESPPLSTEMIMHPQKYWEGDNPIAVEPIDLDDALGDGWREFESNVMGEFWTYLILREHIPDYHARFAAAGWGGDSYAVAYNETTDQTILAINWTFDTREDTEEFYEALKTYSDSRFGNSDILYTSGDQTCSTGTQISCILHSGLTNIQWIMAPSIELIDQISDEILGYAIYKRPTPQPTISQPTPTPKIVVSTPAVPTQNAVAYPGDACTNQRMWTDCGGKVNSTQIIYCTDMEVGFCQENLTWTCTPDPTTCEFQKGILGSVTQEPGSECWDITYNLFDDEGNWVFGGTTIGAGHNYTDYDYAYHQAQKHCRARTGRVCNAVKITPAEKCLQPFG